MDKISIGEYTISLEKYSNYMNCIQNLHREQWNEVKMPGADGLSLDIDFDQYLLSELAGTHKGFLICKKSLPIGYLSVMIGGHHQHKGKIFAYNDALFIKQEYRSFKTFKVLLKLFEFVEEKLKEFGVEYFVLSQNTNGSDLSLLAKKLNMVPSSIAYIKRL